MKYVGILILVAIGVIAFQFVDNDAVSPLESDTDTQTQTEETTSATSDTTPPDSDSDPDEKSVVNTNVEADSTVDVELPVGEEKVFNLSGVNFAFDVTEIRVQKGDTVTINFESADGFHDWVVDEFDAATERVRPGTPTSVTFVADQKGTFEYYCSVGQHRAQGMVGTLIVE